MTPRDAKHAIRKRLRALRRDFVLGGGVPPIEFPELLERHVAPGTIVASYLPTRFEAEPRKIAEHARALGASLSLPHVDSLAEPMRFLAWAPGDPLEPNAFGIEQPASTAEECVPDIILAPLLGFDDALHRLGQGGGFYDRAFAQFDRALRIGIAWSIQQLPDVPREAWDMPLHAVITERGLFGRNSIA